MSFQRRSKPELAGSFCSYKGRRSTCMKYARYAVVNPDTGSADGVCGTHLAEAVRNFWREIKHAPVVQEIPGMWH